MYIYKFISHLSQNVWVRVNIHVQIELVYVEFFLFIVDTPIKGYVDVFKLKNLIKNWTVCHSYSHD